MLIPGVMLLPEGWTFEKHEVYGTVIKAVSPHHAVCVDLRQRGFVLGVSAVPRGLYYGRAWKERLYQDAVMALENFIANEAICPQIP